MYTNLKPLPMSTNKPLRLYLAAPYINNPELSFKETGKMAAELMNNGYIVFSPISHGHAIVNTGSIQNGTSKFWLNQDLPFLGFCDVVAILKLPGWENSNGVAKETKVAMDLNIPVYYIDWAG